jgi:5'-deoxynucleotidase YfbR-like HD superfamily hydrolase
MIDAVVVPPTALLAELGDLKRVRAAGRVGSLAEQAFLRSWAALAAGADPTAVALHETARALAATRLSAIDADVLCAGGMAAASAGALLRDTVRDVAGDAGLAGAESLADAVAVSNEPGDPPDFASALCGQPRAGATAPGRPRLVLEPAESHGDHCLMVAVYAVLLAPGYEAKPGACFLAGLAHHLHNAGMPDAGFAGEAALGRELEPLMATFREQALAQLQRPLRERARSAARHALEVETAEGRAVVGADVLDRVLQMRHFQRAAAFTLDQALVELELVHAGPLQDYGNATVKAAGLR